MTVKTRPTGYSLQPYRQASGYTDAKMLAMIPQWKAAGIKRILRHGFIGEMTVTAFESWAQKVRAAGLDTGAAFGMGSWTKLHPVETGTALGKVFAHPLCSIGAIDAEGAYDVNAKASVVQLGQEIRSLAPLAFIIDQLWFAIMHHPGFPTEEFALIVDERDPQVYDRDFVSTHGHDAYPYVTKWYETEWAREEKENLAPKNLVRPRGMTMEGSGYDEVPYDCVDKLYNNPDANIWTEWQPPVSLLISMQAAIFLQGYVATKTQEIAAIMQSVKEVDDVRPMTTSRAVVGVYQKENGLTVDYKCGYDTMAKMGFKRPGVISSMFSSIRQAIAT